MGPGRRMKRKKPSNVTRVKKTQEKQCRGPHIERSTENNERKGEEEEAEERKGNKARSVEQEKFKQAPMEDMVEFECLQAGQQC